MSKQFSSLIWDYVVFAILLFGSTVYPIWKDISERNGKGTKANYVFGHGKVSMFAMMLSIARGTLGVRTFLGYPSELFYRGAGMWETLYGIINAYPIVCFIFVPVYCNLDITSVYHYLDLRFKSKLVRRLASLSFILRNGLTLGITVYTPCVALHTIAGIPYWVSLSATTILTVFFTVLGGLKAAITADTIQGLTIIAVSLAVIAKGTYETGSVKDVYQINKDSGRLEFFNFTGDITTRVDTLSAWTGQFFISLSVLGCQQNLVQRYLSMKSVNEVRRTLIANIPFVACLFSLAWVVGMAIYATYRNCDPLVAGYTERIDSILPFFVNDQLSLVPGFMGLFLGTLFNGALCMNVSNINSLATVTWEDFLSTQKRFQGYEDKKQLYAIKYLSIIYAFLVMGIAYCVGFLSGVIEGAMLTSSATTGPLVGVFLLAMLVPAANGKGAAIGMIVSKIVTIILIFGSYTVTKSPIETLPTSTEGCTNSTFSPWIKKVQSSWMSQNSLKEIDWEHNYTHHTSFYHTPSYEKSWTETIFGMSYMYYSMLGTIITMVVAIIVSYLTKSDDDAFDESLLHPITLKVRNFFTCPVINQRSINEIENTNMNLAFVNDENMLPASDVDKGEFSHVKSIKSPVDLRGVHLDV